MALPSGVLWIDGIDISSLSLGVLSFGDIWGGPRRTRDWIAPYDVVGAVPSLSGAGEPRRIPLRLALSSVTFSTRVPSADAVHALLGPGLKEFRLGDAPDRVLYGIVEQIGGEGLRGDEIVWLQRDLGLPIELVCYDPVRYDRYDRVLGLSGTAQQVDLGPLAASKGAVIELFGAATPVVDPIVHFLRGQTHEEYGTLTTSGVSLGTNDALRLTLDLQESTSFASGSDTLDNDLVPLGSWDADALQPGRERYCFVSLSATSGTPTGRLIYRRVYP